MAAKKTEDVPGKTDFVRELPAKMAPEEVVARAKAAGIELDTNRVHSIRAKLRAQRKKAVGRQKDSGSAMEHAAPAEPVNKAAFVRDLPEAMPVAEAIERAKGAGFDISAKHVATIRSEARAKKKKAAKAKREAAKLARALPAPSTPTGGKKRKAATTKARGRARPVAAAAMATTTAPASGLPTAALRPGPSSLEGQYSSLVLRIGIVRAKEILARIEAKAATFGADA